MKLKTILSSAIALAFTVTAHADVTVYVTGSSAFRAGCLDAIKTAYGAATTPSFKYAHDQSAGGLFGCTRCIFQGNFPGVTGTTTIACNFTGSVEGIRALAAPGAANNVTYLATSTLPGTSSSTGVENAAQTSPVAAQVATFAFSDVRQTSSPVPTPALQPTNAKVGIVVFTPIANNGAPANLTNLSAKTFQSLFTLGTLPLSNLTGLAADTRAVFATGRNDGSGTRTTYMAESGLGITTLVNQYVAVASTGTALTTIQRVTHGGLTTPPNTANASTLWGQDLDGNGGYNSGGAIRTDMGKTSTATSVIDADGSDLSGGPSSLLMVAVLGTADALVARQAGAKFLGWNGVTLDSLNTGTTMSVADRAKITEGSYTMWSYEQFYAASTPTGDLSAIYTAIKNGIPTRLVASGYTEGIPLTDMHVSRPDDGAPVAP